MIEYSAQMAYNLKNKTTHVNKDILASTSNNLHEPERTSYGIVIQASSLAHG